VSTNSTNNFAELLKEHCPDDYKAFMEIKETFGEFKIRYYQCVIVKDKEMKKERYCTTCRRYKLDEGFVKSSKFHYRCPSCAKKAAERRR
jgi:Zn finger protein HypA/HybF involved in hydrogenase expression